MSESTSVHNSFTGLVTEALPKWIVLDNNENPWGPFDSPKAAKDWAEAKWPGLQWADDDPQGGFWDIVALGAP